MIHPIRPGPGTSCPTRCASCARSHVALIEVFERFGYGEVATPAIEYDEVLARGDERGAPAAPTASSTSAASCSRCART